jgi:DNA-directed RNA polymerase alpha subunit
MKSDSQTHPFDILAKPAQRALANAGIKTLQQLSAVTEAELMQLHGVGKNALQTLKNMMADSNLSFKK